MHNKFKVKFIHRGSELGDNSPYQKQTKNNDTIGNCKFIFNPLSDDYDWLVIIDDITKRIPNRTEILKCPKENTILVTTEPPSITKYGKAFANQFNFLITNQDEKYLSHNNAQRGQTGNIWFYGKTLDEIQEVKEPNKTKKISTVCSNKQQGHTIHKKRFEFTEVVQKRVPQLERFGKGYNWIDLKADAIDDYEFHIAIENHYAKDIWTEKLADTFLGYAVPIYYGCPNVYDYFPKDSIILIDIFDVEGSIKKIKQIIETPGEYERRLPAVKEARRRVIEEYNLLSMIDKIVTENSNEKKTEISSKNKIFNRRKMRTKSFSDLFTFLGWKIKNFTLNLKA
ncbi:MAG: glycosyltransferase family 10 domain-containing protein [Campylobacterota bacterium]